MIGRIQGHLEAIEHTTALVRMGDPAMGCLTYEVMLPAYAAIRLQSSIGQQVSFLTFHFLESQGQGTTIIPRLAGFLTRQDRDFFELFTTCKGVGNKRALRAMTLEPGQIAAAIADRDVKMLQTMPEIGKRMAETIIATLHGKINAFVAMSAGAASPDAPSAPPLPGGPLARQAMEVLLQLGENRAAVAQWIEEALRDPDDRPADVQALVARIYTLKTLPRK